jgi:CubicO group peptidase (beta-lactamase class C family)
MNVMMPWKNPTSRPGPMPPRPALRGTLLLLLPALIPGLGPTAAAQEPAGPLPDGFQEAWSQVEALWRQRVASAEIVGSSLAFVHQGRIVASSRDGLADLDTERPVDEETIYHWASITKTLTGIAILQLRDRDRLDLQDPITLYLPELRGVHNPFGSMDEITLEHLLTHSAGFRGGTWPWSGGEAWEPHEPTEWSQLVAMIPYTAVEFEPGSRYSYSNPGIVFLGRVIEILSGEDWEVYVEKNVLRPLGMSRSYFDHTPYFLLPHRSNNYYRSGDELTENGLDFDTGITVSNGGLNAPVPDMARYLAFLGGAPADAEEARRFETVLSRASLEEMWSPRLPVSDDGTLTEAMGLVFFVQEQGGRRYVGHTGGQVGFITFIYLDPETGAGAIGAFNTLVMDPGGGQPVTRAILADVRGELFRRVFPLFVQR